MQTKFASIEVALHWNSVDASHVERRYFPQVSLWRDIFPGELARQLAAANPGESAHATFSPTDALLDYSPARIERVSRGQFAPPGVLADRLQPRAGRFYPRSFVKGTRQFYQGDRQPCRCLDAGKEELKFDFNLPPARLEGKLIATLHDVLPPRAEHGGRCVDIPQAVSSDGPGMQARRDDGETDFFAEPEGFGRMDGREDRLFYAEPRFVAHLDRQALSHVEAIYRRYLEPGMAVLDLMSGPDSHLPHDMAIDVSGLGMNSEELQSNARLTDHVVHDLNSDPRLPYDSAQFDLVVCTVSVEYLIRPREVFGEIARVLRPAGRAVVTFSDRWFPSKAIQLWSELHPFERVGLVLAYFRGCDQFTAFHSESVQGYLRPEEDQYAAQRADSDPVFMVTAIRRP